MFLEIGGAIILTAHFLVIAFFILWFGLRKPTSAAEFWRRFRRAFLSLGPQSSSRPH